MELPVSIIQRVEKPLKGVYAKKIKEYNKEIKNITIGECNTSLSAYTKYSSNDKQCIECLGNYRPTPAFQPFPKQALIFTCLQNKPFANTVGKGEIARNEQFLLFPLCFLPVFSIFCHLYQI